MIRFLSCHLNACDFSSPFSPWTANPPRPVLCALIWPAQCKRWPGQLANIAGACAVQPATEQQCALLCLPTLGKRIPEYVRTSTVAFCPLRVVPQAESKPSLPPPASAPTHRVWPRACQARRGRCRQPPWARRQAACTVPRRQLQEGGEASKGGRGGVGMAGADASVWLMC